ncbi:MAG: homoserine kinase [Chloroflexi bacterium]|nr:MAG: homoserine kinase [Chloroflexota bacterium]
MRITIRVPATVANLGPGFDILALALQLQNDVVCDEQPQGGPLSVDPGADAPAELHDPLRNRVTVAYTRACAAMDRPADGVVFRCVNRIPMARGLGSSAAAALGGVLAAVAVHHAAWDADSVLDCVEELEGHRDNAAAALLGGLAICAQGAPTTQMNVPEEVRCVVFVPDTGLATEQARAVVPASFSREDAVFNASRCALLVRCLALRDYGALRDAMDDRWHQAARSALVPAAGALMTAAREAGAAGAALAGAGPSIVALTPLDPAPVAAAFEAAAAREGVPGRVMVLDVRNYGTRVDVKA